MLSPQQKKIVALLETLTEAEREALLDWCIWKRILNFPRPVQTRLEFDTERQLPRFPKS
jgi:hypothetical protein